MNSPEEKEREGRAAQLLDELAGIRGELLKRVRGARRKKATYEAARKDLRIRYGLFVQTVREYLEVLEEQGQPVKKVSAGAGRPDRLELPPEALLRDEEDMRSVLGVIVNLVYFPETDIAYSSLDLQLSMDQTDSWIWRKRK